MDVELRPGADFRAVVARLKGAPPELRKKLNAEIRSSTKPIEGAARNNVLAIESEGSRGGGSSSRADFRHFKGAFDVYALGDAKKAEKKRAASGLRQTVARAIQTKITYSGHRTGVRVRVDGTKLPENQRSLPKAMNAGKVRHPTFGNRNIWSDQTFTPKGWFTNATREHGAEAVQKIKEAARKALKDLG